MVRIYYLHMERLLLVSFKIPNTHLVFCTNGYNHMTMRVSVGDYFRMSRLECLQLNDIASYLTLKLNGLYIENRTKHPHVLIAGCFRLYHF